MLKFRTMVSDAEQRKRELEAFNEMSGPVFKVSNDPRVTPIGRFLRKYSLDELPQLWNVLKGDLSLIGPRPELPLLVGLYEKEIPYYELRYLLKPGITGWAQLCYPYGASVEDAYQKLQFEIYYLKNRSLWLDITIILKTIKRFFVQAG